MGCLNVNVNRIGEGLHFGVGRIGNGIKVNTHRIGEGLKVNVSLICTVGTQHRILWSEQYLNWLNNEVGVIKYNYLTATGDWSLEEVIIEELL